MGKVLLSGNHAIAEAAMEAGCSFYAGYPITPQNSIPELMARIMPESGGAFIQAESEIAAINMVYGASAAGARAMTSSSGPGISLMQECISFLAAAELPSVIVNVARGGPGLGNISASQADYFQATRGGGHGDYRTIVYAPSGVQEAWDLTLLAFEKADEYRTPVMILTDGIVGQMMEPMERSPRKPGPLPEKDWALSGASGRPPRVIKTLHMEPGELEKRNWELNEKYGRISSFETVYEYSGPEDPQLVIVAFGIAARLARPAMESLEGKGVKGLGLLRPISLWPFPSEAIAGLAGPDRRFLVFELNAGQMVEDVRLAVDGRSEVLHYGRPGGTIVTPEEVAHRIMSSFGPP
jgi:2-oxoglutarate ferredoxin oxidoreductase subunit alpha